MKSIIIGLIILVGQLHSSACEKKKKPNRSPNTNNTSDLNPNNPDSGGAVAKSMEQCNDAGQAWIAVVDGGQQPAACGDQLADWGCCKESVVARFPSLAQELSQRIDSNNQDGFQLYNCSRANDRSYTLHFARLPGDGKVDYREVSVSSFANQPDTEFNSCPQIPDVNFSSGTGEQGGSTGGQQTEGEGSQQGDNDQEGQMTPSEVFFSEINPILKTSCANSGCHGAVGPAIFVLVDNENGFNQRAAKILDRINRSPGAPGAMPPQMALTSADRATIADYIDSL